MSGLQRLVGTEDNSAMLRLMVSMCNAVVVTRAYAV